MQEVYELPISEMIVDKSHRAMCVPNISEGSRELLRSEVLKQKGNVYIISENEDKNVIVADVWEIKK